MGSFEERFIGAIGSISGGSKGGDKGLVGGRIGEKLKRG